MNDTFTCHVGHPVTCCSVAMLFILELAGKVKWLMNKVCYKSKDK